MKIKKTTTVLLFFITFNILSVMTMAAVSCPAGCNYLYSDDLLPYYKSYTFFHTSNTPNDISNSIENAIDTWNTVDKTMQLSLDTSKKVTLNVKDTYNTIGSMLSSDAFAVCTGSYTSVAANVMYTDDKYIYYSDIILNKGYTFGNGQSNSFSDYQGILTHELGHVWGLSDLYEDTVQLKVSSVSSLPVMYGNINHSSSSINVSVFLRYLKEGDKNGLKAIKKDRGF